MTNQAPGEIVVAGRVCHFSNHACEELDGFQEWIITSKPFGQSGDCLRDDGRWVAVSEADSISFWPTRAAAETFARSLAAQGRLAASPLGPISFQAGEPRPLQWLALHTRGGWSKLHHAQPTRELELEAEVERLLAELDPPVCRLQFPDGSVPGNVREAAEGWNRVADERLQSVNDYHEQAQRACININNLEKRATAAESALAEVERRAEELQAKLDADEFWKSLPIENSDDVRNELADYHFVLEQVPKVYCAITGGKLSKPNYHADVVIAEYEDSLNREIAEATKEAEELAADAESALSSTLRGQERSLREALENGERFYQLELREDEGWVALSDRVHEGAGNFKSTADWLDAAKVYHTYQDMRLVQVTKLVLHERNALAPTEPPAQGAE